MINYIDILKKVKVLSKDNTNLRRFNIKDVEDVYEYSKDEVTVKYLSWNKVEDINGALEIVQNFYNNLSVFAIVEKDTDKCIGAIDLRLDLDNNKASIGYVLNRKYWNKNHGSNALSLLIKLAFEKLELNRLEATHYVGNEGSGRVMEKCGMIKEGLGKDELIVKEKYVDVVHYAITKNIYNSLSKIK